MKGNAIFIGGLIFILLIGAAGWAYKEGYFSTSSSQVDETKQKEKKDNTIQTETKTNDDTTIKIDNISSNMIDQRVTVKGTITSRFDHKNGHVFLTIEDETGSIKVVIFSDKNISKDGLIKGKEIKVSGVVDEYEGELEIIPEVQSDVTLAGTSGISKITEDQVGQQVDVVGTIVSKYPHPEGHLFLNIELESKQEISLPLFSSLNPNSENYPVHSVIKVKGTVKKYKGDLQVVPNDTAAIQMIQMGDDMDIAEVNIPSLTEQDRGKMVIAKGYVTDIEPRNDGHLMFSLEQDGKGIKTILFRADSEEISGRKDRILHAEKAKFPVRVVAMVDVYEGELELIVDKVLND